jgi:hypothetical protein
MVLNLVLDELSCLFLYTPIPTKGKLYENIPQKHLLHVGCSHVKFVE